VRPVLASALAIGAVLGLALGPSWRSILQACEGGRLHAPSVQAIARIPPVIAVHLAAALAALALGAALMLVRKGRTFHRIAGWVWVSLVALVAGSSLFITSLHPGRYSILHLFTGWTMIVLPLAVIWAKRHEVARHRRMMMGLFYGGFAANIFIAFIPGRTMWMLVFG
jgi:uncharacterized membrane protein